LVRLRLIPPDRIKWIPDILRLSNYYKRCLERYLDDCLLTPLDSLDKRVAIEIEESVHEALPWFGRFAQAFNIPDVHIADVELRIQRIFAVLCHDAKGFKYSRGYQYFGYVGYLVALCFGVKGGLPLVFCEALASHIARAFISIVAFTRHLDDLKVTEDHMDELVRLLKKFGPSGFVRHLEQVNFDLLEFTCGWEKVLFARNHAPWNLLLVWDHILFHADEYRKYMRYLMVAHFRQMVQAGVNFESKESINGMQWRVMAIIDDTEDLMHRDSIDRFGPLKQILCPCLPFLRFL
jgi:hypothetical protein